MSKDTKIQWADSSLNLQMGCDGCELWSKDREICYAGIQTTDRAGFPGWPKKFSEPVLFPERLGPALKWKDLSGTQREEKPWLNGYPRIVFLNDMGDTFSRKLDLMWLADHLPEMSTSPHQFLLLTKRPSRAIEFTKTILFPDNFWIGTSVTNKASHARVKELTQVAGGRLKFVSFEPLWDAPAPECFEGITWAIFGGESGKQPNRTIMDHIFTGMKLAREAGAQVFVKQLGTAPYFRHWIEGKGIVDVPFRVKDSHGGDWSEWPEMMRVREMPKIPFQTTLL